MKQYAVQVEVSKSQWSTMQHMVEQNLELELNNQCNQHGYTIISTTHQHQESFIITDEGTIVETVMAYCLAIIHQSNESTEQ